MLDFLVNFVHDLRYLLVEEVVLSVLVVAVLQKYLFLFFSDLVFFQELVSEVLTKSHEGLFASSRDVVFLSIAAHLTVGVNQPLGSKLLLHELPALLAVVSLLDSQQVLVLLVDLVSLLKHEQGFIPKVDSCSLSSLVKELQLHLETITETLAKALPELGADTRLNADLLGLNPEVLGRVALLAGGRGRSLRLFGRLRSLFQT